MSELQNVVDSNFKQEVLDSKLPVVVDFTGQHCRPCKKLMPVLEELKDKYEGRVKFVKVYVEDSQNTATTYGIFSLPTILFIKEEKEVARFGGTPKKEEIIKKIDSVIA